MPGLWGIREWQLEDLFPRGTNRPRTDPPPTPGPCGVALTRAGGAALYHGRSPGGDLRARRDCVDGVLGPIPTSWRAGRRGGFIPCKPLKSGVGTSPTQTEACFDNLEMGPAGCLSNMYRFCALLVFWRYWGGVTRPCVFLTSIPTLTMACASPTPNGTSASCSLKWGSAGGGPEPKT